MTSQEAARAARQLQHAAGGDPFGVRTVAGATAAYLRGDIDVVEFELRLDVVMRVPSGASPTVIPELAPGELSVVLGP